MSADVEEFLTDLSAGTFEPLLAAAIAQVALAVMEHEKKGELTLKLGFIKNGGQQVKVTHKIDYKRPTSKGTKSETISDVTPMYVSKKGAVSQFPKDQEDMFNQSKQDA